jgi:tetratricopeptide (TPR) repeat protein
MVTFAIRGMTLARHVARPVAALAAAGVLIGMAARLAWSQVPFGRLGFGTVPATHFELSGTVQLDEADSTVRTHLGRVKEYLADRQWEEAVQTLMEVMEQSGAKLLGVTERRFVSVRDYCHLQLANLPPEALALYRSRVDPMAQRWYEEGIARRDRQRLLDIVEQAFASSWGDNALYALGEMALESGDYAAARAYWEKCVPADPPAQASPTWLCVPDTDLDLAAIRARLVLASILEGSVARAEDELAQLARLHPDARGRLGGREVNYVEALTSLLAESRDWPVRERSPDWPTFAGSPARNGVASEAVDPAEVAWRVPLRPTAEAAGSIWDAEMPVGRVAEDAQKPLSYHPVVVGDLVLVSNQAEVLAIDLRTGGAAWGDRGPQIFRALSDGPARALHGAPSCLGVARSTLTAFGRRLYVRAGSPITSRPREVRLFGDAREGGYLVSLDLDAEGRLVWLVTPPEGDLSFEGSPVTDGANVYVALRRSDIQPQAHVACFDAASGQLRWQRFVCAAETPAQGILCERTHNLLTLDRETIYVNTNLGAVAALSARDGRVKWVSLYPRVREGDLLKPAPHFSRPEPVFVLPRGLAGRPVRRAADLRSGRRHRPDPLADRPGGGRRGPPVGRCRRQADRQRREALLDRSIGGRRREGEIHVAGRPRAARVRPGRAGRRLRLLADSRQDLRVRFGDRPAEASDLPGCPRHDRWKPGHRGRISIDRGERRTGGPSPDERSGRHARGENRVHARKSGRWKMDGARWTVGSRQIVG